MGREVKVKAKFKGTSRRFEIYSGISWGELSSKLSNLFNLEPDFCLKYRDDENELVLISSQEELDEALKVYQKDSGLLRLFIEDTSAPQTTDTTLLNLEDRNQDPNQGKKVGMDSCYAAAASLIAPEFAAMNARLESKRNKEASQTNKPAVSHDDQTRPESGASSVSKHEEPDHLKYVDFSEVMASSKQQDQSSEQNANKNVKGTSRGWFNNFDNEGQHQPPNHMKSQTKKNKSKKKKSFYSEVASTIAPQLASIKVRNPQERTSFAVASEANDTDITDISEPPSMTDEGASLSMSSPPSEISGENLNNAADFNHQMIQNGQQRVIKRPKRPKKHGKKKSCYAQAALDIGPLYQAMNARLKEQQLQHQNSQDLNGDSEEEMPAEDSPEYEPFVFVDSADGEFLSSTSIETEQTDVVVADPPEQQMDSEPSGGDREMNENVTQDPTDIKVPHGSMELIVEQAVECIQQLNLDQSSQAPSVDASTITGVYVTSKVVHKGITCDNCKDEIQGVRYKCGNCRDFDLCEPCETKDLHDMNHVFVKLKFPAPGIGRRHGEMAPIFKNSVYKSAHDKKLRKAEKEEKKAAYKQLKHALKAKEKERKRGERCLRKQKQEMVKSEQQQQPQQQPRQQQQPTDPRAQKMAKVYEKLKMEYVRDVSFPDGSVVSPGQKFLKIWAIQNVGTIAWNQWIKLECIEGGIMVAPEKGHGLVPHLEQGEQGQVSVEFIAPELPGTYSSKWHLTYGLHTFGPQLWCEIVVASPNNAVKEKPVLRDQTTLVNSAFVNNTPLLEDTKLQAASYHIGDDSGSEYLSSEETQQGKELIPISDVPLNSMESQQRQDLEWDAGCVHDVEAVDVSADNDESLNLITFSGTEDFANNNNSEDSDYEEDSDSSLDEFTVLIPPCFDPDAPLSADPTPVKVECPKRSGSFSSKYLPRSFEPYLNLDDNEPSSLPTMSSPERVASFENLARNTDKPTLVQSAPTLVPDASADQGEETPSGSISPVEFSGQRSTQTQTPASIQSHITPGETVPLVSHFDPIARVRPHSCDRRTSNGESPLPTNVVSDVLSSAIDVVTNAGKAAIATVDNFINGGVQASAVYKPEDDCEVTVERRSDAPPSIVSRAPGDNLMSRLIEMGFADRRLNEQLLRKHNNDLRATIDELLSQTENDWSSQRH